MNNKYTSPFNLFQISDADLNILYVDVKFGGATHDSFVFSNTAIKEHLETLNRNGERVYLLGKIITCI